MSRTTTGAKATPPNQDDTAPEAEADAPARSAPSASSPTGATATPGPAPAVVRDGKGRFVPGCSGNPNGRPPVKPGDVANRLANYTLCAVDKLYEFMQSDDKAIAFKATLAMLDRGIGKPRPAEDNLAYNRLAVRAIDATEEDALLSGELNLEELRQKGVNITPAVVALVAFGEDCRKTRRAWECDFSCAHYSDARCLPRVCECRGVRRECDANGKTATPCPAFGDAEKCGPFRYADEDA